MQWRHCPIMQCTQQQRANAIDFALPTLARSVLCQ